MKKLKVDHKRYALFDYTEYMDRNGNAIQKPKKTQYEVGDVVYITSTNAIGVVLGCVDNECQELRTDMDGMRGFSEIRLAKKSDFKIKDVRFRQVLQYELFGKADDWTEIKYYHVPSRQYYKFNGAGGLIRTDNSTNVPLPLWLKDNSIDWKPC